MAYCTICSLLIEHMVTHTSPLLDTGYKKSERWELEKDLDFKDSMAQCVLCKFIYQSLELLFGKRISSVDEEGKLRRMSYFHGYGYRYRKGKLESPLHTITLRFPSVNYLPIAHFSVRADMGDPAAATISTQPLIHKDESEVDQICALVRNRLYECIETHPDCGESNTSGAKPRLPTRVLYVKNATSYDNSVRLVQTCGETGAYCALSHCWGPVDKQPIRTLEGNIQDHYSGISLLALPRTFQEAAILTQRLGIDYLWIDSLCIQQDDDDDWRREAASMGLLYQQATLVIAATGSADPTGGLFICERSSKIALKLPYASNGNTGGGTFNLVLQSPSFEPLFIRKNPLLDRAWAFQESYLSRRIVLFTDHGVGWRCITRECDETGCHKDFEFYEHQSWLTLLGTYSERKLTRPSDRLPALQGIVNDEENRRNDVFLSEGVWEREILEHLLWYRRRSVLAHDNSALPSWSWAATEGSKGWIYENCELQYDHRCAIIQRSQPAHLSVCGDLVQGKIGWAEMKVCCKSRCEEYLFGKQGPLLGLAQIHLLQSDDGILGFAALDQNEEPSSSTGRSTLKLCILSKTQTSQISEPSDICFDLAKIHERCLDNCIDLWQEFRNIDYVLWALVLEPVADNEETYRRVGLATLFPRVQTAGYCRSACFTLK